MDREVYHTLENYMLCCMEDAAHDKEHVYRVLYNALEIAKGEKNVNYDVLIAACLLHDIGRKEQFENPVVCHAMAGGEKAYQFLTGHGFEAHYAKQVKQCIQTHRYRSDNPPQSLEARILFDADKLDVTGAIGIARTLLYKGIVSEPLYSVMPDGVILSGENDMEPSFFREYKYKLEGLYSKFYTETAAQMAKERQYIAAAFYECLYQEVCSSYEKGRVELGEIVLSKESRKNENERA